MEIAWLEDFLAILEWGSFSRAAEARHVTQSALSRRVRALEEWVGTQLFLRTTHAVSLTSAGESFRMTAEEVLRRLSAGRNDALDRGRESAETIRFASTNALSLTFFPVWLRRLEKDFPHQINMHFTSNHMEACERMMVQGQACFLLGHYHPAATTLLDACQFKSVSVGDDVLMPVSVPAVEGSKEPFYALPGTSEHPVSYLSYAPESGMGRIVAGVRSTSPLEAWLRPSFKSHLAKLLIAMAIEGRGMGWLPKSNIAEHLASGQLVPAGPECWDIPIKIQLFRPSARQSPIAEQFWTHVLAHCSGAKRDRTTNFD